MFLCFYSVCNVNNVNNVNNVKNIKNVNNINNVNCKSVKSATLAHHLGPIFGLVLSRSLLLTFLDWTKDFVVFLFISYNISCLTIINPRCMWLQICRETADCTSPSPPPWHRNLSHFYLLHPPLVLLKQIYV